MHGDEGRTEALHAGIVLVAARLVDGALAAPFGRQRLHRDAVRLDATVATAFADQIVDDDALVRVGEGAALAAAALLGGAGLVINENADARYGRQFALQRVEIVAVVNGQAFRPFNVARIFIRLVGDDHDAPGAFGRHLRRDLRHGETAIVGLTAGHRYRVVEQNLVGHRHAGGDRGANGEVAGVVVGAVAEILENMIALGERRFADPVGALAAHLGVAQRLAIHPLRHVMATDAGIGAAAFRHARRRIVRTARAEIRNALGDVACFVQCPLRRLQSCDIGGHLTVGVELENTLADGDGDIVGVERALDREQPVAVLVLLADADRLVRRAVEFLAHLHFDQRTFLFDDDDEVEAGGEFQQLLARNRPDAADLEKANADIVALDFVQAEFVEGLAHVEIGLAGGDDADFGRAAAGHDRLVDLVGAHEGQHGVALVVVQPRFLTENGVDQTDI